MLRHLFTVMAPLYLAMIYGLPLATLCFAHASAPANLRPIFLVASPILYAILFVVIAGLLSCPHHRHIVSGHFQRDLNLPAYFHRRVYGLCWTALFYFKPVYFLCLTIPLLRKLTFRIFGYRGNLDFTIYPDTWVRDLPLLRFGAGAYLANRATLGSNICLQTGEILVGPISVGARSVVGHLAIVGLGSTIGDDCEIGVRATCGLHVTVGNRARIGAISGLNHGCWVGSTSEIGAMSYIGLGTRVSSGSALPATSFLHHRSVILDPTEWEKSPEVEDDLENQVKIHRLETLISKLSLIRDVCVMKADCDAFTAIVVPNVEEARARSIANIRDIIKFELDTVLLESDARDRLSDIKIYTEGLPRNSAGQLDRLAIRRLCLDSASVGPPRPKTASDETWLKDAEVQECIGVLQTISNSHREIHPDDTLEFDLGLDSMARLHLLVELESALKVKVADRAISEAMTIREFFDGIRKSPRISNAPAATGSPVLSQPMWSAIWFGLGMVIRITAKLLFSLDASGLDNLPKDSPFIICANHQSYLDPPVLLSLLPWHIYKRTFILGTSDIFSKGFWKCLARTVRLYPVDSNSNLCTGLDKGTSGLQKGMVLLLYPEGERTIDGSPGIFKKGAATLSTVTQVPICPVAIDGFYETWPRGHRFKRFAPLRVRFGKPIPPIANIDEQTRNLAAEVNNMWMSLRNEASFPKECEAHRNSSLL